MSSKNELKDLSWLFMIRSKTVKITASGGANYIEIPKEATVIAFSDRPYRMAKTIEGGIVGFANFFINRPDFPKDPPNVTFVGESVDGNRNEQEHYTIFELEKPLLYPEKNPETVSFRIAKVLGEQKVLPTGTYSHVSLIVDDYRLSTGQTTNIPGQKTKISQDETGGYHYSGFISKWPYTSNFENKKYTLISGDQIKFGAPWGWVTFYIT